MTSRRAFLAGVGTAGTLAVGGCLAHAAEECGVVRPDSQELTGDGFSSDPFDFDAFLRGGQALRVRGEVAHSVSHVSLEAPDGHVVEEYTEAVSFIWTDYKFTIDMPPDHTTEGEYTLQAWSGSRPRGEITLPVRCPDGRSMDQSEVGP